MRVTRDIVLVQRVHWIVVVVIILVYLNQGLMYMTLPELIADERLLVYLIQLMEDGVRGVLGGLVVYQML